MAHLKQILIKIQDQTLMRYFLHRDNRLSAGVLRVSKGKMCRKNLKGTKGQENLTLYQWNTKTAKHYFCKTCGIYTHHQRRSTPTEFGFNVACLDEVNPYDLGDIPVGDGRSQELVS